MSKIRPGEKRRSPLQYGIGPTFLLYLCQQQQADNTCGDRELSVRPLSVNMYRISRDAISVLTGRISMKHGKNIRHVSKHC